MLIGTLQSQCSVGFHPSSAFIPRLSPHTWYMSPHCPLARCETYRWVKLRNSRPRPSRPPNRPSHRWHLLLVTRAANEPSPKFWPRSSRGHGLRHICHAAVTLVPWQQVSLVASDPVMWRCDGVMSCVTSRRLTHCTAHTPAWPGLHIVHMPGTTWPRIHQGCRKPVEMWDDWLDIYYLLSTVMSQAVAADIYEPSLSCCGTCGPGRGTDFISNIYRKMSHKHSDTIPQELTSSKRSLILLHHCRDLSRSACTGGDLRAIASCWAAARVVKYRATIATFHAHVRTPTSFIMRIHPATGNV